MLKFYFFSVRELSAWERISVLCTLPFKFLKICDLIVRNSRMLSGIEHLYISEQEWDRSSSNSSFSINYISKRQLNVLDASRSTWLIKWLKEEAVLVSLISECDLLRISFASLDITVWQRNNEGVNVWNTYEYFVGFVARLQIVGWQMM